VIGFAAHRPAGMQGRQQALFVDVFEDGGQARRQIVVQQDGARIEVFQADAPPVGGTLQGLQHKRGAIRQLDWRRFLHIGRQAAKAHIQSGLTENLHQPRDILQVKSIARVAFRYQQQVLGIGTIFLDGGHGSLHCQRQHFRR